MNRWKIVIRWLTFSLLICFAVARADTQKVSLLFDEADSLMIAMDYKGAEKAYKNILKIDKESFEALSGLARLNVIKRDWGDVKKWSDKLLKLDSDYLDGHYYKAIANRETGYKKGIFLKNKDFSRSEEHFQFIIDKDREYRDVLYQRGKLESHRGNWVAAFDWAWQQIEARPELANGQSGLYKTGRLFIRHTKSKEIEDTLAQYEGDWTTYFRGEMLRRQKDFTAADSLFTQLLENGNDISKVPVYLSLIKIHAERNEEDDINLRYWQALEEVSTMRDIMFFHEDAKYAYTLDEWRDFRTLLDVQDYKTFFRDFWANRDPVPASPTDYGLIEHYRRFVFAEEEFWFDDKRSKINDPDTAHWLTFPETYYLNQEFSDKGLVYMRQGPPNDIAKTSAARDNESWLYQGSGERSTMVLHFAVMNSAAPGDWRFTSVISDPDVLEDRLGWDSSVNNVARSRNYLDYSSQLNEMGRASERAVKQALTTCYYSAE